ncbi:MAG: caspase family protein [Pseudomonadota bacterium]
MQLDTGGHMALVRDMVFTPDGRYLITASDDKTVRIWDLESRRTVRVLRGQIDEADGGKIYAIALSPDGRYLAVAGHTGIEDARVHPVRLYNLESGELVKLYSGHREPVLSVSFSPDGARLASAGMDDSAIVWRTSDGKVLQQVRHRQGDINVVRFTADGERLVTGGDDSLVMLWRISDGRLIKLMRGHEKLVRDIAIAPDGKTIVSSASGGGIRIWDAQSGDFQRELARRDVSTPALRFTPDGRQVLGGSGGAPFEPAVWDVRTGDTALTYRGHDNIVLAVAVSPDGKLAATAGGKNNEIHIWTLENPQVVARLKGRGRAVHAVGVSEDTRRIAWGYAGKFEEPNDTGELRFMLRLPSRDRGLGEPRPVDPRVRFARNLKASHEQLTLAHESRGPFGYWDTLAISRSDELLGRAERGEKDGYTHNAYGFVPGGKSILSAAGHGWLSLYDLRGRKLRDYDGHSGDVWTAGVSRDGGLLISGSDDQTVRLWNTATGENIVSLFHASDGEWVIWTPQGYFAASPDGDDHIGWHINEGPSKAVRLITAAQLKRHFYRPDIVRRALELFSARAALEEAPRVTFELDNLLNRKPPVVEVLSPSGRSPTRAVSATVRLSIGASLDPIQSFELIANGRRVNLAPVSLSDGAAFEAALEVPLTVGRNRIEIRTLNAVGRTSTRLELTRIGGSRLKERGTLYLVAVGVDDYAHFAQDLRFAGADALAFRKAMETRAGGLYKEVRAVTIAGGAGLQPTAANIRQALQVFEKARPEDTVVLFLAGHGVNVGADYLFLPGDAQMDQKTKRWKAATVLDWRQLHGAIEKAQGRRIMVVDTCKAGNAYNPRLIKDADDAFVTVLAATDAETLAQERPSLGHGVFTYSILRGLNGEADAEPDRQIRLSELAQYVTENVKGLTAGKQEPTSRLPDKDEFVISTF